MFRDNNFVTHAEDARRTWGETKEFTQRQQRTARYTQQDWEKLRAELAEINHGLSQYVHDAIMANADRSA